MGMCQGVSQSVIQITERSKNCDKAHLHHKSLKTISNFKTQ